MGINRGNNYCFAAPFKMANFCKVLEEDGFVHSQKVSHLGLTVSPLVPVASLFYIFQRLEVKEETFIMRQGEAS